MTDIQDQSHKGQENFDSIVKRRSVELWLPTQCQSYLELSAFGLASPLWEL